jgi:hypothetical protein
MATVVTVHGTFAHADELAAAGLEQPGQDLQWWQQGSRFEQDLRGLVDSAPEPDRLEFVPFEWNGYNSEVSRREAGKRLLGQLDALEKKGEPYCLVGHSHGGSVIGWALVQAARRRKTLDNLQRWITVGTPFVGMQKEPLLFQRLGLMHKVVFVGSLMLLAMFLVYLVTEIISDATWLFGGTFVGVLSFSAMMMSLPMIFFTIVLKFWDMRKHAHFRNPIRRRARTGFAHRWRSLTHTDDEAVQGLAFLPGAKLRFFEKSFAVQTITMLSVVALPLIYLSLLASPALMVSLGEIVKTKVYEARGNPEAEQALRAARQEARRQSRQHGGQTSNRRQVTDPAVRAERRAAWATYRQIRDELAQKFPELPDVERSLRFKARFFEKDGVPCEGGKLCGKGRDLRINSGLLLHLVTDELSSAIVGEGSVDLGRRSIWTVLIPAVLVPILFGLAALVLMLVIRAIAHFVSAAASHFLNSVTNSEVKRAAFGNDTEGEIAIGALDRPSWIDRSPPRLPVALADIVTDYSNGIASHSLAKFRRAIGQLASAEPKHTADTAITTYFTWKELVHASYFDVPEFRKLVAQSISRADGFAPTARFQADPDFSRTARWLAAIEGDPGTTALPDDFPPTQEDKAAVAATVVSTAAPLT